MRVQASMNILDSELIEHVVEPKKATKEFNPLLVSLLRAYYQNYNGLRDYIDGGEYSSPVENVDYSASYQEARDMLAAMDVLFTDGQNMFSEAEQTFSGYMEYATEKGVFKEETTESGVSEISLSPQVKEGMSQHTDEPKQSIDIAEVMKEVRELAKTVSNLASDVAEIKRHPHEEPTIDKDKNEKTEVFAEECISSEPAEEQVEFNEETEEEEDVVISEPIETFTEEYEEETDAEEEVLESSIPGEATDSMQDLLSSLGM